LNAVNLYHQFHKILAKVRLDNQPTVLPETSHAELRTQAEGLRKGMGEEDVLLVHSGPMEFILHGKKFDQLFENQNPYASFDRAAQAMKMLNPRKARAWG